MLDHVSSQCEDPAASAAFYDAVLPTTGGGRVMDFGEVIGCGMGGKPDFWIGPHNTGYAAFVRDPHGNNVEAVCHLPEDCPPGASPPAS